MQDRMKELLKENLPKINEVVFTCVAPDAKEVFIAGDFNNWTADKNSLMEKVDGVWRKKMVLDPGSFYYRFVVDGEWIDDPVNPNKRTNPFGQSDSLIEVKAVSDSN